MSIERTPSVEGLPSRDQCLTDGTQALGRIVVSPRGNRSTAVGVTDATVSDDATAVSSWGNKSTAVCALTISIVFGLVNFGLAACGKDASSSPSSCTPGTVAACTCADSRVSTTMCLPDGTQFAACACGVQTAGSPAVAAGSTAVAPSVPKAGTAAPVAGTIGAAGVTAVVAGRGPVGLPGQAGTFAVAGRSGAGGRSGSGAGAGGLGVVAGAPAASGTGAAGAGMSSDQIETARQVCVTEINMYRATLSLTPLMRGTAAQEMCSDTGAKKDGDSGAAHGSAADCISLHLPGQQDTCPGWPVGGRSGSPTVADALKKCLASMWAEGMPPVSREACIADRTGCFPKYGHYLNMSDPGPKVVACGFYQMTNGSWWMNQNFGR